MALGTVQYNSLKSGNILQGEAWLRELLLWFGGFSAAVGELPRPCDSGVVTKPGMQVALLHWAVTSCLSLSTCLKRPGGVGAVVLEAAEMGSLVC